MGNRAAIYLRVSTDEQTTENQERALREVAARSGHEIVVVYRDEGISGSKGRDKRPGFDAMHKDAARRRFNVVMARSVGRSIDSVVRCKISAASCPSCTALASTCFLHPQGIPQRRSEM